MKQYLNGKEALRLLGALFGMFVYAFATNVFIVPLGLYNGGAVGLCQMIRTLLTDYLHISFGSVDISGIIYYAVNLPILFIAAKRVNWFFFFKVILCVTGMSLFLTLIPAAKEPILGDDILASCLIGGLLAGGGCGFTLMMGGSAGGTDIVGLLLVYSQKKVHIGRLNLTVNLFLYALCLILFDAPTAIYSIIFASICSFALDRMHAQNIDVEVCVLTKPDSKDMQNEILETMDRGITRWRSEGAYTGTDKEMLYILLSKYEVQQLKNIVHKYDPKAFIVVNEGVRVDGNYHRKI